MILGEHNWNTLEVTEAIQALGSDFDFISIFGAYALFTSGMG